jgi:meso-butanediol dehydrogenase/(S,S)-butanediol dehydrogenase/diacetyl reductase
MKLENKVAVVTGGGQSIGRGIVLCLAEEGADVVIVEMNEETAQKTAGEVKDMGRKALVIKADVTKGAETEAVVKETMDAFGKIDILVNNVGGVVQMKKKTPRDERVGLQSVDTEEDEWDKTFELNVKSQYLMCRSVIPHFLKQKSGKIINIGSRMARQLDPGILFTYAVTKSAVVHYTKQLAIELSKHNINVNAVCPGDVLSPNLEAMFKFMAEKVPEAKGKTPEEMFNEVVKPRTAFNHIQTAEDMGRAAAFLVSEDAKNITGQALYVDGGQTFI